MTSKKLDPTERALHSVQASGFPLQTRIADVISRLPNWALHRSEYAWRKFPNDHKDEFLDLIVRTFRFFLCIECKKTRDQVWTFLRPVNDSGVVEETDAFRCLSADRVENLPPHRPNLVCETIALSPSSLSAEFCAIGTDNREERLLERTAGLVIGATDAFAQDPKAQRIPDDFHGPRRLGPPSAPYWFVPMIVTNAKLFATCYKPAEVSLISGEFDKMPDLREVKWIRFNKEFTAGRDVGARSVFIVTAESLESFLAQFNQSSYRTFDSAKAPFKTIVDYSKGA
jgi:hypothetical protein